MGTLGIHIVWTTYGTWLPGDDRGHWSALFDFYGHLLARGGQLNVPDQITHQTARNLLKEPLKILDQEEIDWLSQKIGDHMVWPEPQIAPALAGVTFKSDRNKKPSIFAAAIESTHVHLLLGPVEENLDRFIGRLKGTTSSTILHLPANQGRSRTWTAKFWKVFLFNETALLAVKQYIENHNLRKNLPASPYSWLTLLTGA